MKLQVFFQKVINRLKKYSGKYYYLQQHDETDCGAACLAMVAGAYDLKIPVSRIRQIAGTDKKGTTALGLVQAARKLGFTAKGVKGQIADLTSDLPQPLIAHVIKDGFLHYVVIYEITPAEIVVADPAQGLIYYQKEEFEKIWTGILILLVPAPKLESKDERTGLFSRFYSLIIPHKRLLIEIFLASILYTILGLAGAFYFKYLIDTVLADGLTDTLHIISAGVIILTVFRIMMKAFRSHLLLYLSQKIDVSLILNYYRHILQLPLSFFDSRRVGAILSRLRDASKIREAISGATISVMIDSLLVVAGGIVLYLQSSLLFTIAASLVPVYMAVVWGFNHPFRKIHRQEMEQSAEMQSYLVESISGMATVKAFNAEREAHLETETRFIKYIKSIFRATWLRNFQFSLQKILTSLGELTILWVGGWQVIKGNLSIGQLITFNALLAYFFDPIQNLIKLQPQLQEAFVASDRLGEILDLETENESEFNKVTPEKFRGRIEINNVDFRYGNREKVLENIDIKIDTGDKIALVGESGSGKTTLVRLLLKYYLPTAGNIVIDDYNIEDINLKCLRNRIGYVPQDVFIFSGTIRDNIAFGHQQIEMEEIIGAAQKAKAHDFINKLPLRYETMVGERGSTLSGGQRQRLAIARAILKQPDILILDEATSNLDTTTEKAIHNTIADFSRGLTTIIIAHRLSTIRECDKIIVLNEGKIIEKGDHRHLLEKKGQYYQLWQSQSAEPLAKTQI